MFRLAQTVLDTSRQIRLDTLLEGAKSGAQTGNGTHTHTKRTREAVYLSISQFGWIAASKSNCNRVSCKPDTCIVVVHTSTSQLS